MSELLLGRAPSRFGDVAIPGTEDQHHRVGLFHERQQRVPRRIRASGSGLRHHRTQTEALDRVSGRCALRAEVAHHRTHEDVVHPAQSNAGRPHDGHRPAGARAPDVGTTRRSEPRGSGLRSCRDQRAENVCDLRSSDHGGARRRTHQTPRHRRAELGPPPLQGKADSANFIEPRSRRGSSSFA